VTRHRLPLSAPTSFRLGTRTLAAGLRALVLSGSRLAEWVVELGGALVDVRGTAVRALGAPAGVRDASSEGLLFGCAIEGQFTILAPVQY
jgi:hypothetical protein